MESIYRSYFGLVRDPFNVAPDPAFLYLSASHREALAQLVYGIKARKGFVVLTGEVGTGKTTLVHALLKELNGNTHTALIFNTIISPKELLRNICDDFGLVPSEKAPGDIYDYLVTLNKFLLESYRKGDNVALIIDEAQDLSPEVLESIRLLSNFETSQDKLLQIFLVGQPELGTRLNSPELRQLKQRVTLRHHLRPLSFAECKEYVARRLEVAGGAHLFFTLKAIETVYLYSGGTPRLINILCDNGMLTAYGLGKRVIDDRIVAEVAEDLNLTPSPEAAKEFRLLHWWRDEKSQLAAPPQDANSYAIEASAHAGSVQGVSAPPKIIRSRWKGAAVVLVILSLLIAAVGYWASQWTVLPRMGQDLLGEILERVKSLKI